MRLLSGTVYSLRGLALSLMTALTAPVVNAVPAWSDSYSIDRDHTEVCFSWDHLGMSRQSGCFEDITGRLEFDPARPETSQLNVRMALKSMSTGVAALDQLLTETGDYFDASRYPDIIFRSTAVTLTTSRTANITGDLTMNGITKPVTLSAVWNYDGEHPLAQVNPTYAGVVALGFSARARILRSQWGVSRTVPLVSDEIRIQIEAELLKR